MTLAEPASSTTRRAVTAAAVATFEAIGTTHSIVTTDPASLAPATELARGHLDALDHAVSRFRPDSEVCELARAAEKAEAWLFASELFNDHLDAALHAAHISGGLVDFTVGRAVMAAGYDADLPVVLARPPMTTSYRTPPVPGWRTVQRGPAGRVTVPRGTMLDFGATAKARAADTIARLLVDRLPGGFLVILGGDIATSGPAPDAGWRVGVEAADGAVLQVVTITDQAIATSSTQRRRWVTDSGTAHHIINPITGRPAAATWAQVTCVGIDALEANTAATAAIVLGDKAVAWLTGHGIAARLDGTDGSVVWTPGWPHPLPRGAR